ncbi:hypothetical protein [Succinatimonas hippei]|mgnify:CR=1 FL=1|uniref:hypothetical protein n=1 Tax=Succinatimonas hippei TaxID=626938 RepID=UPI00248F54F8|nr:hypothetical protein [Succinatimonas hippei]
MKFKSLFVSGLLCFALSGCSVYMASNQADKKDLSLLKEGMARSTLIGAYGAPQASVDDANYGKCDVWRFVQGYSNGAKTGRVATHAVLDVLTIGLWEIAGSSIESAADGTQVAYQVCYDKDQNVAMVVPLSTESAKERDEHFK